MTINYITRTNVTHFHDYLIYVIALPIIVLKHSFTVSVVHKKIWPTNILKLLRATE